MNANLKAFNKTQTQASEMRNDMEEFVRVIRLIELAWSDGDLAQAVNRASEWANVVSEKYSIREQDLDLES